MPTSLGWIITYTPEATHLGAPVPVLGTNISDFSLTTFQGLLDFTRFSLLKTNFGFALLLLVTRLHRPMPIYAPEKMRLCIRKCHIQGLRRRTYKNSSGILTGFPFAHVQLGVCLGSTNPRLTDIAEEPLPFRRRRFSLLYDPTTARIFIPMRSLFPLGLSSALIRRLPTILFRAPQYR